MLARTVRHAQFTPPWRRVAALHEHCALPHDYETLSTRCPLASPSLRLGAACPRSGGRFWPAARLAVSIQPGTVAGVSAAWLCQAAHPRMRDIGFLGAAARPHYLREIRVEVITRALVAQGLVGPVELLITFA
jgi:hypothetical protein